MKVWLLAGVAAFGFMHGARADVMFSLSNVAFVNTPGGTTPEGTLTGSFSTNNALSAITTYDITASPATNGTNFPFLGFEFTPTNSSVTAASLPSQYFQLDPTGPANIELRLYFNSPLTSSGTTLSTPFSYENENIAGSRFPVGSIVAAAATPVSTVPEPASLALLGLGMAGLAATRRRRAA